MLDTNPAFSYKKASSLNSEEEKESMEDDEEEFNDIKANEFIFLLDRSGSMSGARILLALEALKLFVHSLPVGSKFNIVSYGSNYNKMFDASVDYTEENLERCMTQIETFKADMGGTEIFKPLKDILD